jgi:hypothetical protein
MTETPRPISTLVTSGLATAGLTGPLFDAEAIGLDLADRLAVDAALDEFVGVGDPGAPAPFTAEDPQ